MNVTEISTIIFVILKNMKMNSCFLLLLYFGITCCREVYAENEHDVKRGMYPFMAFIYYSDPTVIDATGQRFIRSAVLIRPDWLVTTALGASVSDSDNGFPTKTLLARAGAISIDAKFTLNEDEDEQEREIVEVVRPYNHSATQWWTTDISLMKTLLPFNMTSAVAVKSVNVKQDIDEKTCSILVYTKYGNMTEEKNLMVLFVELLPPSITNCGSHFASDTMACASDSNHNKNALHDPDFCRGNRGGPLICDNEVIGLQTYIDNNCEQPHLYQLLHAWDNFISCGIENKCQEEQCGNICDVTYKDPPKIEVRASEESLNASFHTVNPTNLNAIEPEDSVSTETIAIITAFETVTETKTEEPEFLTTLYIPTVTLTTIEEPVPPETTLMTTVSTIVTMPTETSTERTSSETSHANKAAISSQIDKDLAWLGEPKTKTWPKVKAEQNTLKETETETSERTSNVEAHQQVSNDVKARHSASSRVMSGIHTVIVGSVVVLCL